MTITVQKATSADLAQLFKLHAQCSGSPRWSLSAWQEALDDISGRRDVYCAFISDSLVGLIATSRTLDICEVETIAVTAEHRRLGVATSLLRHVLRFAAESGATASHLEVRVSNTAARFLYASLGFSEDSLRRSYYHDPVEDAVLLSVPLPLQSSAAGAKV